VVPEEDSMSDLIFRDGKETTMSTKPPIPCGRIGDTEPSFWACGECGTVFRTKEDAEHCHAPRICPACGEPIKQNGYCRPCADKRIAARRQAAFEKAEKILAEGYPTDQGVVDPFGDDDSGYYPSLGEALGRFEDEGKEPPPFFWATTFEPLHITKQDIVDLLERIEERHHEDASFVMVDSLEAMIEAWNKHQKDGTNQCDVSRAVVPGEGGWGKE
jgi:hypothetical protein